MELALPEYFHGGTVRVVSLMGRKIADMDLISLSRNGMSVWNVSPGIFLLTASASNGEQYVHKFSHGGGDVKISTSLQSSVHSIAPRSVSTIAQQRAATAQ